MKRQYRPFWLPASNYYVLAVAVSAAFFFLVWGILHDTGDDTPWITAGISSSILLAGGVILREVVLRHARVRLLRQQRMMESAGTGLQGNFPDLRNPRKLTIEQNAAVLAQIRQKSEAARVLGKFSAGHREVFELCSQYIARNENELSTVNAGSPRLAALLKGRTSAMEMQKYHLLQWAEIEARSLANEARTAESSTRKIASAQNALTVIQSALDTYPAEPRLIQSREMLRELVASVKVTSWVEKAERAAFKGNYAKAKGFYRDALFYLGRENDQTLERQQAAALINEKIERLRSLESGE